MITEQLIQLKNQTRVALGVAGTLIFLLTFYEWVLVPHVQFVRAVHAFSPIAQELLGEKASLRAEVEEKQLCLADLYNEFADLKRVLFTWTEAQDFLDHVENSAESYTCTVSALQAHSRQQIHVLGQAQRDAMVEEIDVTLSVTGTYADVSRFLDYLQNHPRWILIRSLYMDDQQQVCEALRCQIVFTLCVLYESNEKPHDAVDVSS